MTKLTKWLLYFVGILILISFLGNLFSESEKETYYPPNSGRSSDSNQSLLEMVRKEPKVKEAIITDANVLYVSVLDDGTKRDGYASYLCELVRETKSSVNRVKVVKVNSTNDPKRENSYGVLLGESWCE